MTAERLHDGFHDRRGAGRALAAALLERQRDGALPRLLVFALPRGGLPVAREVAETLGAPLEALVARKIGAPGQPELAVGALSGDTPPLWDDEALRRLGIAPDELAPLADREREELRRRENLYREDRPLPDLSGRTALIVDDGLATGLTARAGARAVRDRQPARVVVAVPVASRRALRAVAEEADEVVCLHRPDDFGSVGRWYEEFEQLTDDEVLELLRGD